MDNSLLISGAQAAKMLGRCRQAIYMGWRRGTIPKVDGKVPRLWVLKQIVKHNMHNGDNTKLYRYMVILGFGGFRGQGSPICSG